MYRIVYEKKVCKDLDKIPDSDVIKILKVFSALSINPVPPGAKKLSGKSGFYRVRQGDYRIVYNIGRDESIIKIILVCHRKSAYRNL
jgi:mRNA interferase RelE/StbE